MLACFNRTLLRENPLFDLISALHPPGHVFIQLRSDSEHFIINEWKTLFWARFKCLHQLLSEWMTNKAKNMTPLIFKLYLKLFPSGKITSANLGAFSRSVYYKQDQWVRQLTLINRNNQIFWLIRKSKLRYVLLVVSLIRPCIFKRVLQKKMFFQNI